MKRISLLPFVALFLLVSLVSCKKDKTEQGETSEYPAPNPSSSLTVTVDDKTYNLRILGQAFTVSDSAKLRIDATTPEMTLKLRADAGIHNAGLGEYFLVCCSNDVFDRRTSVQKHWEIDHIGNRMQNGTVKITRADSKGYEGTFTMYGNDYDVSQTAKKEFKGSFVIVY